MKLFDEFVARHFVKNHIKKRVKAIDEKLKKCGVTNFDREVGALIDEAKEIGAWDDTAKAIKDHEGEDTHLTRADSLRINLTTLQSLRTEAQESILWNDKAEELKDVQDALLEPVARCFMREFNRKTDYRYGVESLNKDDEGRLIALMALNQLLPRMEKIQAEPYLQEIEKSAEGKFPFGYRQLPCDVGTAYFTIPHPDNPRYILANVEKIRDLLAKRPLMCGCQPGTDSALG